MEIFDRVLLRPLPPLFQIIIERLDIGSFSTLAMGVGTLLYAAAKLNMSLSAFECLIFFGLVLSATLIFAGLVLILVSLTFWIKDPTGRSPGP